MTIHIEPEIVHETGIELRCTASDLWENLTNLRTYADRLEMDWQGGAFQEEYLRQYRILLNRLAQQIQAMDELSSQVLRHAADWETLDSTWIKQYAALFPHKESSG